MSRSYAGIRPKGHRVYSVEELMDLYGVTRNTVTNWITAGLKQSDRRRPYIFRGDVVRRFHEGRRKRFNTQSPHAGEFRCLGCRAAVRPDKTSVRSADNGRGATWLSSECPQCGRPVHKPASPFDLALLAGDLIPNTSGDCPHEGRTRLPARTGNQALSENTAIHLRNDRTLAAWQRHAERHSPKTQDRHLAAIREFEASVGGRPFDKLTQGDVAGFRTLQRALLAGDEADRSSKSTVSHKLSHVRDFLTWLLKQKGFENLPRDLPDYLELSRGEYAKAPPRKRRAYPTIEKAKAMLIDMPAHMRLERRARAIFAIAFLGALRADTIISLRLGHVLPKERVIVQDGTASRTKNGKSLRIRWFPIPDVFERSVLNWLADMELMGAAPEDALFPAAEWIERRTHRRTLTRVPAHVMTSIHAVTEAFAAASKGASERYTPHAAKHTIAALGAQLRLTDEQRKAWSQNMGHESIQITETHYGHLPDERCGELFEALAKGEADADAAVITEAVVERLANAARGAILKELHHLGLADIER